MAKSIILGEIQTMNESPTLNPSAAEDVELIIVSGVSGSGKTTALRALEDIGYFCIDNLPTALLETFLRLARSHEDIRRVAVAIDIRESAYYPDAGRSLEEIQRRETEMQILFLDCRDTTIITRFKETRRRHPLMVGGPATTIQQAIAQERTWLTPLRHLASAVVDTTTLNVHALKKVIQARYGETTTGRMSLGLTSFGFRHGIPPDADFVFDVRYLANPYFVSELRDKTGTDPDVRRYVMEQEAAQRVLKHITSFLADVLPLCEEEGKASVNVAIGCTGGHHRSVSMVHALRETLVADGRKPTVTHRDCDR